MAFYDAGSFGFPRFDLSFPHRFEFRRPSPWKKGFEIPILGIELWWVPCGCERSLSGTAPHLWNDPRSGGLLTEASETIDGITAGDAVFLRRSASPLIYGKSFRDFPGFPPRSGKYSPTFQGGIKSSYCGLPICRYCPIGMRWNYVSQFVS